MLGGVGWLTCEETTAGSRQGWTREHGYVFEVPLRGPEPGRPVVSEPIPPMGRFSHEAVAIDPATGFVYETEDDSGKPNGFFRYRPNDPRNLGAGSTLEMLKIIERPGYDTREDQRMGARLPVEWVRIPDPDPDLEGGAATVTQQGLAQGAATFNRRAAGTATAASRTSSPRAEATRRTATSTPTASRRASARSGRTGRAMTAACSRSSTNRRPAPTWTRRTT